ncbi:MAG: hypothetical protein ABUT39_06195 [Acidobacteriota bacterium]
MLKPDLTFDRLLTTFAPGAVFVSGVFYMNRPILTKYFPYVAGYAAQVGEDTLGPEARIILFSLAAVCMGVIFEHLSDLAIIFITEGEHGSGYPQKRRAWARRFNRLFFSKPLPDPRRKVLDRYLKSNRKDDFLKMVRSWGRSDAEEVEEKGRAGIVHQHILVHLRASSPHNYSLYREIYAPLASAASFHCALVALLIAALAAAFSAPFLVSVVRIHSYGSYLFFVASAYAGMFLTYYNLRRKVRHFFSQSLTLALHAYCLQGLEKTGEQEAG